MYSNEANSNQESCLISIPSLNCERSRDTDIILLKMLLKTKFEIVRFSKNNNKQHSELFNY